ncbi:MAG: hypothetical protein ACRC62_03820 [Microcoleus sp.]
MTVSLEALWDRQQRLHVDALILVTIEIEYDSKTTWREGGQSKEITSKERRSIDFRVAVEIKTEIQSLGETIRQLKRYGANNSCGIPFVLVCGELSETEIKVFQKQNIHVYVPGSYKPSAKTEQPPTAIPGMIAHHINGKRYAVTAYNTSTVTLATKSGRPDVVTWDEIDYLESEDGLQRHRDVANGMPIIVVQPINVDPRWVPYEPDDCFCDRS